MAFFFNYGIFCKKISKKQLQFPERLTERKIPNNKRTEHFELNVEYYNPEQIKNKR
jgi:hypothetical protein